MTCSKIDFASLVLSRMANPADLVLPIAETSQAAAIGRIILRQLKPNSAPGGDYALRMSALGKCARALAYDIAGVVKDGRKIDGRSRLTFAMGDMAEALLTQALNEALVANPELGWQLKSIQSATGQEGVTLQVDDWELPGHPDGVIGHPDVGSIVLEVKSTSSYGFSKWQQAIADGVDPWSPDEGYYWQLQGYIHAMDCQLGYVLALCKDSGAICGWWVERDPGFLARLRPHLEEATSGPSRARRVLPGGSTLQPVEKLSKRTGDPLKGHGLLPWQCRYCSHYRTCYGDNLDERVERDYRGRPSTGLYLRAQGGEG